MLLAFGLRWRLRSWLCCWRWWSFPRWCFSVDRCRRAGLNDVVNRSADRRVVELYPNWEARTPRSSVRDIAAEVFQLVPATKFMKHALWNGESPFWNPYSAAGSLGPETMADIKFSPFVVLVAVFGASATAFSFVALAFVILALFCLQQLFTRTLGAGRVAATASCIVFLLCGFAASDISSQIGAPYVLFPVVLFRSPSSAYWPHCF
jgi:hypothetical protein